VLLFWLGLGALPLAGPTAPQLPREPHSLKFAVIGDNGNGSRAQKEVGLQMAAARGSFPFEFVLMCGDNLYGSQKPADFVAKFEQPYAALLAAGLPFYAVLGNHDDPNNRNYPLFNMGGQRYYTLVRKQVRFIMLDSNEMDRPQLAWLEQTLKSAQDNWKIVVFHHPLYSDGRRHGSNVELRVLLEPLLVKYDVQVVFSGHEHFYERLKPQKGVAYIIEGSSGQLRKGNVSPSATTAAYFDQDQTFMLVEIAGDDLFFQTLSRTGKTVDHGFISRRPIS
jgi:predicted MPP superfamily phosphohydrolase